MPRYGTVQNGAMCLCDIAITAGPRLTVVVDLLSPPVTVYLIDPAVSATPFTLAQGTGVLVSNLQIDPEVTTVRLESIAPASAWVTETACDTLVL